MDDAATTTAKITLTPGAIGDRAMARVSIGSETYEGVVSPRQGDEPDPTAWLTGDLSQCPQGVIEYLAAADLSTCSTGMVEL